MGNYISCSGNFVFLIGTRDDDTSLTVDPLTNVEVCSVFIRLL